MKKIIKTLLFITFLTGLSCVDKDPFELPDISITDPNITANSSLTKAKAALQQEFNANNNTAYTFPIHKDKPTYIACYVISTDAPGNFYKKIIVQDLPKNPTSGLEVLINKAALNTLFSIGQKVFIKLDGLTISYDDGQSSSDPTNAIIGKYTIGLLEGVTLKNIPSTVINSHFFRSSKIETITPTAIDVSTITEKHINTFVRFKNIQFEKTHLEKTFSGEPHDEFDGFRYLFDCETQKNIRLQTSTFASFKSSIIPEGKGTLDAILTKDYSSEFLVTIINTPSNITFSNTERCDPLFLDCGAPSSIGTNFLFNEGFENIKSNTSLLNAGWSNINSKGGNSKFTSKSSGGNRAMELSAYNSGESPLEVWLITPPIHLNTTTDEVLSFETNTGYDNGKVLSVYTSTDFTGTINNATWTLLDARLSEGPSAGYGSSYTNSGAINISCLSDTIHVAFKYVGDDGGITTTFKIDNVRITGN
jgi:hypothetical protein